MGSKKVDKVKQKVQQFLREVEGHEPDVYQDHTGVPTAGLGFNLKAPDMPGILTTLGIDHSAVMRGERSLSPEEIQQIYDRVYDKRRNEFNKIKELSFPGAKLNEDQEAALMSMYYNSPGTIGTNIRNALNENRYDDAAKEILYNTNPKQEPGIMRRRLKEAKMFMGPQFESFVNQPDDGSLKQLRGIASKIENPHTREQTLEENPFLKDDYQPPYEPLNFSRLLDKYKPKGQE